MGQERMPRTVDPVDLPKEYCRVLRYQSHGLPLPIREGLRYDEAPPPRNARCDHLQSLRRNCAKNRRNRQAGAPAPRGAAALDQEACSGNPNSPKTADPPRHRRPRNRLVAELRTIPTVAQALIGSTNAPFPPPAPQVMKRRRKGDISAALQNIKWNPQFGSAGTKESTAALRLLGLAEEPQDVRGPTSSSLGPPQDGTGLPCPSPLSRAGPSSEPGSPPPETPPPSRGRNRAHHGLVRPAWHQR